MNLRVHALNPLKEFGKIEFIRQITTGLLKKSEVYQMEKTKISFAYVNIPQSKSPATYLRFCSRKMNLKPLNLENWNDGNNFNKF